VKRISNWGIAIFLLFGFTCAQAQTVYEVFIGGGAELLGELEFPAGVDSQFPSLGNKNCTTTSEPGFPDCQTVVFRPDPAAFSELNGSSTDLTETLISDPFAVWFIGATGSLDAHVLAFQHDFGSVITDGDDNFQFVELYFDHRSPPLNVCAAARETLLGFTDCFADGGEDTLLDTAEFRLKIEPVNVPVLPISALLALSLLIAGLGIVGLRNRRIKSA